MRYELGGLYMEGLIFGIFWYVTVLERYHVSLLLKAFIDYVMIHDLNLTINYWILLLEQSIMRCSMTLIKQCQSLLFVRLQAVTCFSHLSTHIHVFICFCHGCM